jgi:hypothetical protein
MSTLMFSQLKMTVTSNSLPRVASAVDSSPCDCAVTAAAVASSLSSSCTFSLSRAVAQSLVAVASAAAAAEAACSRSSLSDSSCYITLLSDHIYSACKKIQYMQALL